VRRAVTLIVSALAGAGLLAGPAGCGFADAGGRSPGKPDTVLVRGRVVVPLTGDTRPDGAACAAPASVPEIASGAPVKVTDENGHPIGQGHLGVGVVSVSGAAHTCDFPFEVPGVSGAHRSVDIVVAGRTAQHFALRDLAEDRPAVITVTP
jgi:hypothetical protein